MPLPTLHLLVAQETAKLAGINLSAEYLLGNIAPDAIHMRKGAGRTDKDTTHLRNPIWKTGWDNGINLIKDANGDSFAIGYALHIMTDHLWVLSVFKEFRSKLPADIEDDEWRKIYYNDTDCIDRWLFRQNEARQCWNAVMTAKPGSNSLAMLSVSEINEWRNNRYNFLLESTEEIESLGYITLETAKSFISKASHILAKQYLEAIGGKK